jgi:hypothetical protein
MAVMDRLRREDIPDEVALEPVGEAAGPWLLEASTEEGTQTTMVGLGAVRGAPTTAQGVGRPAPAAREPLHHLVGDADAPT